MSMQPPPAGGVRLPWENLPPRIPAALEAWLGGSIANVAMQVGGFSPGPAARIRTDDGRRVFVKAVGPELNPDTPDALRQEAAVVASLPDTLPAPRLLWTYDEGPEGWVMLVFEDIEGWTPATPWTREELERVVSAMAEISTILTPAPILAPRAGDHLATSLHGWDLIRASPPDTLDPWARDHLDLLVDLERRAPEAARGDTLLHFDIRADNVLLTPERVYVVDWPHVAIGAAWIDMVGFLPSVGMQGDPPLEEVFMLHPAAREADPDAVTAVLASLTGFFLHRATLPPAPGLPTLRPFQHAQGVAGLKWLRERM